MAAKRTNSRRRTSASEKRQRASEARQGASEARQNANELQSQVIIHEDELSRIIREALHTELSAIGLVADSASEATELQKDFAYLRTWRELAQKGGTRIMLSIIGVLATGMAAAVMLWMGVPAKLIGLMGTIGNWF